MSFFIFQVVMSMYFTIHVEHFSIYFRFLDLLANLVFIMVICKMYHGAMRRMIADDASKRYGACCDTLAQMYCGCCMSSLTKDFLESTEQQASIDGSSPRSGRSASGRGKSFIRRFSSFRFRKSQTTTVSEATIRSDTTRSDSTRSETMPKMPSVSESAKSNFQISQSLQNSIPSPPPLEELGKTPSATTIIANLALRDGINSNFSNRSSLRVSGVGIGKEPRSSSVMPESKPHFSPLSSLKGVRDLSLNGIDVVFSNNNSGSGSEVVVVSQSGSPDGRSSVVLELPTIKEHTENSVNVEIEEEDMENGQSESMDVNDSVNATVNTDDSPRRMSGPPGRHSLSIKARLSGKHSNSLKARISGRHSNSIKALHVRDRSESMDDQEQGVGSVAVQRNSAKQIMDQLSKRDSDGFFSAKRPERKP